MEPDITILDITIFQAGITMNILSPGKTYIKMYGTEPRYRKCSN